jgi:hypothetical protein
VHRRGNEGRDGEAVRKRDAQDIVTGSFDGTDPDKDQRKCSNEFSEARTEFTHPSMQSNCPLADNLVVATRPLSLGFDASASQKKISIQLAPPSRAFEAYPPA